MYTEMLDLDIGIVGMISIPTVVADTSKNTPNKSWKTSPDPTSAPPAIGLLPKANLPLPGTEVVEVAFSYIFLTCAISAIVFNLDSEMEIPFASYLSLSLGNQDS